MAQRSIRTTEVHPKNIQINRYNPLQKLVLGYFLLVIIRSYTYVVACCQVCR